MSSSFVTLCIATKPHLTASQLVAFVFVALLQPVVNNTDMLATVRLAQETDSAATP